MDLVSAFKMEIFCSKRRAENPLTCINFKSCLSSLKLICRGNLIGECPDTNNLCSFGTEQVRDNKQQKYSSDSLNELHMHSKSGEKKHSHGLLTKKSAGGTFY